VAIKKFGLAKMTGTHRQVVQDACRRGIYKVWISGKYGNSASVYLDLVSEF